MIDEKKLEFMQRLRDKIEASNLNVRVEDIHYLGDIDKEITLPNGISAIIRQELYEVSEKQTIIGEDGEKQEIDLVKYYLYDEPIAVEINGEIYLEEEIEQKDELKAQVEDKKSEEYSKDKDEQNPTLNEMEQERMQELADTLGVSEEEIKAASDLDADKKINDEEEPQINEEEIMNNLSVKNEFDPNKNITGRENFHDLFPGTNEFSKIYIVYTDSIPQGGQSRFSFVGITRSGRLETIPMEQDRATNSTKEDYNIENDGTVDKEQVTDRLKIPGNENRGFSFKIEQYGEISVKYSERIKTMSNGVEEINNISIDLETSTRRPTPRAVRDLMNDKGQNMYDKQNLIEKADDMIDNTGKETTADAIDKNSHNDLDETIKYKGEEMTVKQAIEKIAADYYSRPGPDPENNTVYQDAIDKLTQEYLNMDKEDSIIDKIENVEEIAIDDFETEKDPRGSH